MIRRLCQEWGYNPEEAMKAPVSVLRMTAVLAAVDEARPKAAS
jgi:hypothetical protein